MKDTIGIEIVKAIKLVIVVGIILFSIYSLTALSYNCSCKENHIYQIDKLQKDIDCLKKEICKWNKK
jgi:hypothetical protein